MKPESRHLILRIFIVGVTAWAISLFVPAGKSGNYISNDTYGFDFALMPFGNGIGNWEDVWSIFLLGITNVSVIASMLTYARFASKIVSLLNLMGSGVAIYWTVIMLQQDDFYPWATLLWVVSSICVTVGYELKRRSSTIKSV